MHFYENTACSPGWGELPGLISLYAAIWSLNASDAEGAGVMFTPRVGENNVYDSPLSKSSYNFSVLALIYSLHRSKSNSSTTAEKQAVQTDLQLALNL